MAKLVHSLPLVDNDIPLPQTPNISRAPVPVLSASSRARRRISVPPPHAPVREQDKVDVGRGLHKLGLPTAY